MAEIDSAAFAKLTSALQGQSVALDKLTSQLGSQDREFLQTAKPITIDSVKTRQGMRPFDTAIADAVARVQRPAEVTVEREKEESLLMKIAKGVVGVGAAVLVIKAVMDNPELKRSFNAVVGQIKDFFFSKDGIISKAIDFLIGDGVDGEKGIFFRLTSALKNLFGEGTFLDNVATTGAAALETLLNLLKNIFEYIQGPQLTFEEIEGNFRTHDRGSLFTRLKNDIKDFIKSTLEGLMPGVMNALNAMAGNETGPLGRVIDILTDPEQLLFVRGSIRSLGDVLAQEIDRVGRLIDPIDADILELLDKIGDFPNDIENIKTSINGLLDEAGKHPVIKLFESIDSKVNSLKAKITANKIEEGVKKLFQFGKPKPDENAQEGKEEKTKDIFQPLIDLPQNVATLNGSIKDLNISVRALTEKMGNGNGEVETGESSYYNPTDQNYGIEQRLMARQMA